MTNGTIKEGEYHPAANSAMFYLQSLGTAKLLRYAEAFASTAISGNRLSEICGETLNRLMTMQPVSDRYLLGLAFTIKQMEEGK